VTSIMRAARTSRGVVIRRFGHEPFSSRARRPLLVHCCHHKVGTVWFSNVLRSVGRRYGLRFQSCPQRDLKPRTDIFVEHHSAVDVDELRTFRGSHMTRDPRDVIVSGYFYHLRTTEPWALESRTDLAGKSYQEHLCSLDKDAGLRFEMENVAGENIRAMSQWDYTNPSFLELRYDDMIADESGSFERLFRHYGFSDRAIRDSVDIAMSFSTQSGRGRASEHIRSGRPGEWAEHLTDDHLARFDELFGDVLVRLGYETARPAPARVEGDPVLRPPGS
jgi:Sulfotransferase domain